eukprot:1977647-Prymnesium_polylepis.1
MARARLLQQHRRRHVHELGRAESTRYLGSELLCPHVEDRARGGVAQRRHQHDLVRRQVLVDLQIVHATHLPTRRRTGARVRVRACACGVRVRRVSAACACV